MFEVIEYWGMCGCVSKPRPFKLAISDLFEEVLEFVVKPSYDEASDVAYCIGRLLGSLTGKIYISVPGDKMTLEKMQRRMKMYQCIQSCRHLKDGGCPES